MKEKKQKWAIKRYLAGMQANMIAAHLQISVRTIYRVVENHKKSSRSIDAKPVGRPKNNLNIRQNAESTNHAKKAKFGSAIRSKLDSTKEAEAMMKWCVYNVAAICRAYYDNAIDPEYSLDNVHIEMMLTYIANNL